jgi:hypothetical protein
MHTKKVGNILPKTTRNKTISSGVSKALKQTHKGMTSAIHHISHVTQINESAIKKWYEGRNPPSAAHLLTLMTYYPAVLRTVLELIDRNDIWQIAVRSGVEKEMIGILHQINPDYTIWGDIHVTPMTKNHAENSIDWNDRQLWFLDNLHQIGQMRSQHIAEYWGISLRTAQRDASLLREAGLIMLVRNGRDGWYELAKEKI